MQSRRTWGPKRNGEGKDAGKKEPWWGKTEVVSKLDCRGGGNNTTECRRTGQKGERKIKDISEGAKKS